jgi:hypothetical protein
MTVDVAAEDDPEPISPRIWMAFVVLIFAIVVAIEFQARLLVRQTRCGAAEG